MSEAKPLADAAVVLDGRDNVATALVDIAPGAYLLADGRAVHVGEPIPAGFKLAVAAIPAGAEVVKYGCPIGRALRPIAPGECVHVHNLASGVGRPAGPEA